ncbi:MAG: hypothetical protein ACREF3_16935, partial [Acetobacteraceae bacterium]
RPHREPGARGFRPARHEQQGRRLAGDSQYDIKSSTRAVDIIRQSPLTATNVSDNLFSTYVFPLPFVTGMMVLSCIAVVCRMIHAILSPHLKPRPYQGIPGWERADGQL